MDLIDPAMVLDCRGARLPWCSIRRCGARGDAPVGVSFHMPGYAEYARALEQKKIFTLAPMNL
jgi:hypothetical protein